MFEDVDAFQDLLEARALQRSTTMRLGGRLSVLELYLGEELVGRFETLRYPPGFDLRSLDRVVATGFSAAKRAAAETVRSRRYGDTVSRIFRLLDEQSPVPVPGLDLRWVTARAAYLYFLELNAFQLNGITFSMNLAHELSESEQMLRRQGEMWREHGCDDDLTSDLSDTFASLFENAVTWGNRGDLTRPIYIGHRLIAPYLLGVQDAGRGCDLAAMREGRDCSRGMGIGGLGLESVRRLAGCELTHCSHGSTAVLDYTRRMLAQAAPRPPSVLDTALAHEEHART